MSYWRKLFIVVLLVLSLPVQSFAAVSMKCALADPDAGEAPLEYAEHGMSDHQLALRAVAPAEGGHHQQHCDSCCAHSCSDCMFDCCSDIALPAAPTIVLTSDAARVITRIPPSSAGTVSFLTDGIERPPRYTLV
jgi:hypothetical protein